jgi:hypothetical protein
MGRDCPTTRRHRSHAGRERDVARADFWSRRVGASAPLAGSTCSWASASAPVASGACFLSSQRWQKGEISRARVVPADREGVRRFLARFRGLELEVALEATSGWRFLAEELRLVGARVHLAEPAQTSALRGRKKRPKTDRADAPPPWAPPRNASPPQPPGQHQSGERSPGALGQRTHLLAHRVSRTARAPRPAPASLIPSRRLPSHA